MEPEVKVRKVRHSNPHRKDRSKVRTQQSAREIRGLKIIDRELAAGYVRETGERIDLICAR